MCTSKFELKSLAQLEHKLKAHLNIAWVVPCAENPAKIGIYCCTRRDIAINAEVNIAAELSVILSAVLRVIERIQELGSKLSFESFCEVKGLCHREIHILGGSIAKIAKTRRGISVLIAVRSLRVGVWILERSRIDPIVHGLVRRLGVADHVRDSLSWKAILAQGIVGVEGWKQRHPACYP